jgi:hypothetical protein
MNLSHEIFNTNQKMLNMKEVQKIINNNKESENESKNRVIRTALRALK